MDIGSISAVRPVTAVRPSPRPPDPSRIFEVEYLGQSADDEFTPGNKKPSRGLEDEEESGDLEAAEWEITRFPSSLNKVSFFA